MDLPQIAEQLGLGGEDTTDFLSAAAVQAYREYESTGDIDRISFAVICAQLVMSGTLHGHPDRAGRLNNLGVMLCGRYERTGKMTDLQEAIDAARQAVESTPEDHPGRAGCLNNLGNQLGRRYERTGEMTDLQEAIDAARQAVESTPEDHPDRAGRLSNLGNKLGRRYERTGEMTDLQEASEYLLRAWNCRTAVPFHRIQSGARCVRLFAILRKVSIAIELGKDIIDLLPTVNTRLLSRADQQFVVATFAGVAADLCAFLLESNCSEEALVYLERGRAIIIGQLIDSRSDVSSLAQLRPEIARRYETLRNEVSRPFHHGKLDAAERQMLGRRRRAAVELNQCIEEIRSIPGHERFLLGQTVTQMQECAVDGTIIVINLAEFRSDAIIVSVSTIRTLNLPELSVLGAKDWLNKDWVGRRSERKQKNEEYSRYLFWLWEGCVKQVLDEVFAIHNSSDLPRIWWIGTGLASSMPFHAAGTHSATSTENVYSRAISSYAPSIKALAHARNRAKATDKTCSTLLMATMSTTPGYPKLPDLPRVVEEKNKVLDIANGHLPVEPLDQPSVDRLIERLRHCSVAHFACHGSTDHSDPSNSGLILQRCRGNQPPEQDRLTVQRVSELSLTHARIAYLSACSTAENKATRLSDEVIHVVSGFQVAGFPHVVGCLWPSNDRVCVEVAGEFYTTLLRQGGMRWGSDEVASALREAVIAVRAKEMSMPLNWAQFVHYGP